MPRGSPLGFVGLAPCGRSRSHWRGRHASWERPLAPALSDPAYFGGLRPVLLRRRSGSRQRRRSPGFGLYASSFAGQPSKSAGHLAKDCLPACPSAGAGAHVGQQGLQASGQRSSHLPRGRRPRARQRGFPVGLGHRQASAAIAKARWRKVYSAAPTQVLLGGGRAAA